MQKILYLTTQSEFGGAQRYIFDLAKNLKNEFNVIVASGNERKENQLANKLNEENIEYYEIKHLKRAISPINDLLALFEIKKLINKIKPDIIHLNSSKISILGSLAKPNAKTKIIYTAHGWVFNEPMSVCKKIFYKYAEKFTARFKDEIICVSEFDYQTAKKEKIAPEEKLITIHNGIEPVNFLPTKETKYKLESLIQNSKFKIQNYFVIGSIGNLYKTKGFEYLINAIKKLSTSGLQILTFIIGEGGERKSLESLIQKNNLEKNIILIGEIKNAAELLPAFDLYVCSSVKEGFPYSILEAMDAGLPIVSTRVGGIPEMIEDKKNGLLAEPRNADDLAEKIKIIIDDKAKQKQHGASAKEKVTEEFSLEKMIDATKNIYLN